MSQRSLLTFSAGSCFMLFVRRRQVAAAVLCFFALGFVAGCNTSGWPRLASVHGHVTLDGKPVAGATVVYAPAAGGRQSSGVTDEQGEYVLKYIRENAGGTVGMNSVRISKQKTHDPRSESLPLKYNRDTTLTAEVKAGTNEIDFPLTSK